MPNSASQPDAASRPAPAARLSSGGPSGGRLLLALAALVLIVAGVLFLRRPAAGPDSGDDAPGNLRSAPGADPALAPPPSSPASAFGRGPGHTPEEVVAGRLAVFARKRLEAAVRLAELHGVQVPAEVRQFFAAVEASDWQRAKALFEELQARRRAETEPGPAALYAVWPAVHEAFGVAEVAAEWPAGALIDYAGAVLGAVPPGTIYLGGTDAGRFAPLLFNDVGGADDKVILTQNALADVSYLEYVNLLHGTRIEALSRQDSDANFGTYMEDAQRRAVHDAEHPDEPAQLRPGESVVVSPDGRVSVSGQVAVMAINEGLLRTLLAKNPDLRFALEESYPMKSLYGEALPAGPIMELRAGGTDPALVQQRANESLELWRSTAERFKTDASLPADAPSRTAWAEMAAAQASYFSEHQLPAQAEETWRRALEIGPGSTKAMFGLVEHLSQTQRRDEARQVVEVFLRRNPSLPADSSVLQLRDQLAAPAPPPGPR